MFYFPLMIKFFCLQIPPGSHYIVLSATSTASSQPHNAVGDNLIFYVDTNMQSSPSPWYNQRWPFSDPSSYLSWSVSIVFQNLIQSIQLIKANLFFFPAI